MLNEEQKTLLINLIDSLQFRVDDAVLAGKYLELKTALKTEAPEVFPSEVVAG